MSIVILLAVLFLITWMVRAALGPPHLSPAQAAALGEGFAEDAAELIARRLVATSSDEPYGRGSNAADDVLDEPVAVAGAESAHERHETRSFHVEEDDPCTSHGYDSGSSTSDDVSCDSDSSDWSSDDD